MNNITHLSNNLGHDWRENKTYWFPKGPDIKDSLGLPLRMNGMHRTEFDHSHFDLLSLVIWSCVFWPSITWNLCKVQRWSKSVLTFDRYRPHYIMFPNFQFNNDKNKERSKTILFLILLYKKTTLILKTAEWITVEGLVSGHPWDAKKLSFYNWSWPLMGM